MAVGPRFHVLARRRAAHLFCLCSAARPSPEREMRVVAVLVSRGGPDEIQRDIGALHHAAGLCDVHAFLQQTNAADRQRGHRVVDLV